MLLLLLLFPLTLRSSERVRKPAFAGSWYPGEKAALETTVKRFMKETRVLPPDGEVVGIICPHAGYMYSGQVAACSYRSVAGKQYDVIVLVGPSHRYPLSGSSVYSTGRWDCPTGSLRIEETVARSILDYHESIDDVEAAHAMEHSLEMQLPFLVEVFGDVPIVPIVVGEQNLENVEIVAGAIVSALEDKKGLIIASSDLSHFHNGETADKLDNALIEKIKTMDISGFMSDLGTGAIEACGGGPVAVLLSVSKKLGADRLEVFKHINSGDVTGDDKSVVGYLAAAVYRENGGSSDEIGQEVKTHLHRVAHEAIAAVLEKREPSFEKINYPVLDEHRGAFVTLKSEGRLRGCIGQLIPAGTLLENIKGMAVAAAFKDMRFKPVTKKEYEDIDIEISVLTPLRRIDSPGEVEVGRDGVYIVRGNRAGVLLPQVATEQGWSRKQFLEGTCRKAGLPIDCWQVEETQIYIFRAQVF